MQKYCYRCLSPLSGKKVCPHCGKDTAEVEQKEKFYLAPGTVLQNRYLIGNCIGSGGFGITYAGIDLLLERKVAVKEYFPADCVIRKKDDREIIFYTEELRKIFEDGKESFIKEAKNLARMGDIQGIVKIYDWIQEMGTSYIIMEFLEGKTVKAAIQENKQPFSWSETRSILLFLLNALRNVHNAGMVHRDITPDNIFILKNGEVKLIDFGAARLTVTDRTQSFTVMLKPGFAPEEQYSSKGKQGPWTDVYALAATAYYMVTGTVPEDAISRFMEDRVVPPSSMNIQIPVEDEKVLMKALSLHYSDRYRNADEMREAFLRAESTAKDPEPAVRTAGVPVYRKIPPENAENRRITPERPRVRTGYPDSRNQNRNIYRSRTGDRIEPYEDSGDELTVIKSREMHRSQRQPMHAAGKAYRHSVQKSSPKVLQPVNIPLEQIMQQNKHHSYRQDPAQGTPDRYAEPKRRNRYEQSTRNNRTGLLIGLVIAVIIFAAVLLTVLLL